jgi:hypothetical protein
VGCQRGAIDLGEGFRYLAAGRELAH